MSCVNDSIVICDTPSPAKTKRWKNAVVTDYKKRLRSSSARNLLGTVYESPLLHFKRNQTSTTNIDADLGEITVVPSPLAKKRKITTPNKRKNSVRLASLDESVVIINDARTAEPDNTAQPVVELGTSDTETNDVEEVSEPSNSLPTNKPPASAKSRKKDTNAAKLLRIRPAQRGMKKGKRKVVNLKSRENLQIARAVAEAAKVNDENHNGQIMEINTNDTAGCPPAASEDAEDVEVVWVSGPEATRQPERSVDNPFVVDTAPSYTYLVNTINLKSSKRRKKEKRKKRGPITESSSVPASTNSVQESSEEQGKLREIVIDGSNVGMGYLCGKGFSEKGLKLVIDYFKQRGHVVKAFLPQIMRKSDRVILERLHREGTVVFTPSRRIGGKTIIPYDDRYILDYATQCDGIVVSSDQYRDLWLEKPQWRNTIEKRLLTPTFAGDYLMFPEDPLGRFGPKLDKFLRH